MHTPASPSRKRVPKQLAVIYVDHCTGCGACVEVCPVDCIEPVAQNSRSPGLQGWCEIDWNRCIGCRLCIRLPKKAGQPLELLVCPWGAIEMAPLRELEAAARRLGGPAEYSAKQLPRRIEAARRQIEAARAVRPAHAPDP